MKMIAAKKLAFKICIQGAPADIIAIARAAMRIGISEAQSILIARLALKALAASESEDIRDIADGIVRQGRYEHATRFPNGQWARLFARHGSAAQYMNADSDTARAWHEPHAVGTEAYYLELAYNSKLAALVQLLNA